MTALLSADRVTLRQGGFALAGVSLTLHTGEMVAVTGPNGAGKSTLLKALAGLVPPAAGRIAWTGADLAGMPHRDRARRIAWAPQEPTIPDGIAVKDYVALARHARGAWSASDAGIYKLLKDFDLQDMAWRSMDGLSGGEKRRALLARALAQGAEVLLLDEPTAHLDPRHQAQVLALLARARVEQNTSVMLVMHDLRAARTACPRVVLMDAGRVRHDGPWDALTPALLQDVYGLPLSI